MKAGDLILTPPMCWHGHINESDHRIIWFDAANMPLIRALDAHFFEPGDPQQQRVLAGRRGRREAVGRSRACRRRGRGTRRGAFAEIPLFRRGDAPAARGAAARRRRRAHHPLRQSRDRRRRDADARLLCRAPAARARRRGPSAATYNVICLVVSRRGPLDHRRADLRMVAARRVHHPALDLRAATRRSGGDADLFIVSDSRRSSGSTCCARNCSKRRMRRRRSRHQDASARQASAPVAVEDRRFLRRPRPLRRRHRRFPARCTACSCARRTRMRASAGSTQPRGGRLPGVVAVFTGADMAADGIGADAAAVGDPLAPTARRWPSRRAGRWRATRCAMSASRSPR